MPEWAQAILSIVGAAFGAWAAIRIELRFVWRDIARLEARLAALEGIPRRRRDDFPRTS